MQTYINLSFNYSLAIIPYQNPSLQTISTYLTMSANCPTLKSMFSYLAINLTDPNVNPTARFGSIGDVVLFFRPLILSAIALAFLGVLMYGGFTFLTAGGDSKKIAQANQIFLYAILGIAIVAVAGLAVQVIGSVFQVEVFNL